MAQFVGNDLFPSFESSLFPEAELGASMSGAVGGASVTVAQVRLLGGKAAQCCSAGAVKHTARRPLAFQYVQGSAAYNVPVAGHL